MIKLLLLLAVILALVQPADAVTKHIKLIGLDDGEFPVSKQELIDYAHSKIDPLDLDLELVWDGVKQYDGNDITINFTDAECPEDGGNWFGTREWAGYLSKGKIGDYELIVPFTTQVSTLHKECLYKYNDIGIKQATYNAFIHELIHAITQDKTHIKYISGKMPVPVMSNSLSANDFNWTFNDERILLLSFGKHGKVMKFTEDQIGKTAYILYPDKEKDFSFTVTDTVMHVDWMPRGQARKVIK